MEIGSIVKCIVSFEVERTTWGFDYPKMGDILTVRNISQHPDKECHALGIVLLEFQEKPSLIPVCDRQFNGNHNFMELLPNIDLEVELQVTLIPEKQ